MPGAKSFSREGDQAGHKDDRILTVLLVADRRIPYQRKNMTPTSRIISNRNENLGEEAGPNTTRIYGMILAKE